MTSTPPAFESVLFARVLSGIEDLRGETAVCALSLFVCCEEEGPTNLPALNLGYNTRAFFTVKALEAHPFRYDPTAKTLDLYGGPAEDEREARWNPACWKDQWFRQLRERGEPPDREFIASRARWVAEQEGDGDTMWSAFVEIVERIAFRLHDEGHLARILGNAVPVIVLDVDRSAWAVDLTLRANPRDLVAEYPAWAHREPT